MKNKKDKLAAVLARLGVNPLLRTLRSRLVGDLPIVAYHRVCDIDDLNDSDLVSASVDEFDWQVAYIKRHYHPMTFADIAGRLQANAALPKKPVVLTFDDGFADNYVNAFPILRQHGVPATFFVSTGYIGERGTFWFNQIARLINANPGREFVIPIGEFAIPADGETRSDFTLELLDRIKLEPNDVRLAIIESMQRQLGRDEPGDALAAPMTWEQVVEMSDGGMEIGSHTVTHPILTQISPEQLIREISDSKREIEAKTGRRVHCISYPEGLDYAISSTVTQAVAAAGYSFGASYLPGTNYRVRPGNFLLRRGHIERYTGRERFAAMLAVPELFQ